MVVPTKMQVANTVEAKCFMDQNFPVMMGELESMCLWGFVNTVQVPFGYLNVRFSMMPEKWFGVL